MSWASLSTRRVGASNLRSTIDEYVQANASTVQPASLKDFADKPLVVLEAGLGSSADWPAKQEHLAGLSTNSAHRVIDATHDDLVSNQADAAKTTQAILDVVSSVRSKAPIAK